MKSWEENAFWTLRSYQAWLPPRSTNIKAARGFLPGGITFHVNIDYGRKWFSLSYLPQAISKRHMHNGQAPITKAKSI